jgi:hypothetical protein
VALARSHEARGKEGGSSLPPSVVFKCLRGSPDAGGSGAGRRHASTGNRSVWRCHSMRQPLDQRPYVADRAAIEVGMRYDK